jgi:hypothetical protein
MTARDIVHACFGDGWGRDVASRTQPSNARKGRKEVNR